jgi:hypothetical protein
MVQQDNTLLSLISKDVQNPEVCDKLGYGLALPSKTLKKILERVTGSTWEVKCLSLTLLGDSLTRNW